ncbi:MAG TPA: hypothetical protein VJ824_00265 [Bacillota bacterium]|nr:hypothetical protein [Bacillota bacterium]
MKYRVTYKDWIDESCDYQMVNHIILNEETLNILFRTHKNQILKIEPL